MDWQLGQVNMGDEEDGSRLEKLGIIVYTQFSFL